MNRFVLAALLFAPAIAMAQIPLPLAGPGCDDDDGDGFLDVPGDCPPGYTWNSQIDSKIQCKDADQSSWNDDTSTCEAVPWDRASFMPHRYRTRLSDPAELDIPSGMSLDKAWQRTTGRFDTTIAIMDSGIRWSHGGTRNKYFLNRGELPVPFHGGLACAGRAQDEVAGCPAADAYDCNRDCIFNVRDYDHDDRVNPLASNDPEAIDSGCSQLAVLNYNWASQFPHTNTFIEPADLLCTFSDGTDGDGNGYIDDVSGWDTFWDDPNPADDTNFGHGTGEAQDSVDEGGNGGTCPSCSVLMVRVGDSFVVDSNNWAAGVVFAVDSGVKVLQSAVGAINNTKYGQAAIEYAYDRGVINIISAADETAQHQNYPGAIRHSEYVHAVRYDTEGKNQSTTFVNFSNCTNFGVRLTLSASSTSCSSGATGVTSGIAGLLASHVQDQIDAQTFTPAPNSITGLSGAEIHQVFVQGVDEINLPTSHSDHPDYNDEKYPSSEGWDLWFGYGRINAAKVVDLGDADKIAPTADILEPRWYSLFPPDGDDIEITGIADAPRGTLAGWTLEYAMGPDPKDTAVVDTSVWTTIASGNSPKTGVLGTLNPGSLADFDAAARIEAYNSRPDRGEVDTNVTKAYKLNRYTLTIRLRITDTDGNRAEDRRAIYVHKDYDTKPGFPLKLGVSGESSPKIYDLNDDGAMEIIIGDSDGLMHAIQSDGSQLPGWPKQTNPGRAQTHSGSYAFTHGPNGILGDGDELEAAVRSGITATPAIGDIDEDGEPEIVAATIDGELYAWDVDGTIVSGFPIDAVASANGRSTDPGQFYERGIFSTPALADLDGDGALDIIVATMTQKVLAFTGAGQLMNGFPVSGVADPNDETKPYLRLIFGDQDPDGQGRRIVSSPAIGDLDNDGNLEVVIGTNEAINEQFSLVYAFSFDKGANKPVAYGKRCGTNAADENCWPIIMVGGYPNALPYVGEGVPSSPVLADLNGDGTLEIGAASIADFGRIYRHDGFNSINPAGSSYLDLKSGGGFYGVNANSQQSSSLMMINSASFADLDGDGSLDYLSGTAGANFVDNLLDDGKRADFDHQLSVWNTTEGTMVSGFPQIQEDLQFFLNPIVADITGDGEAEVINTSGTFALHAFDRDGNQAPDWPKFTGQWQMASPAVGDLDGDGLLELTAITRAGDLYVWDTDGAADGNVQWPSFRHDAQNTGNYGTPDAKLAIPEVVKANSGGGDDDGCGCAAGFDPSLMGLFALLAFIRRRRG